MKDKILPLEEMGIQLTTLNHAEMYYKVYVSLKCGLPVDITFFLAEMPAQNECSHKENEEAMEGKKNIYTHQEHTMHYKHTRADSQAYFTQR